MRSLTTQSGRHAAFATVALVVIPLLFCAENVSAQDGSLYEVTITNLTRGQQFTPILVATHQDGVNLFALGTPASAELEILAETGNTAPLTNLLLGSGGVFDVATSAGLLDPGASVTVPIRGGLAGFRRLSIASMLIPTNDGFLALDGVWLPTGKSDNSGKSDKSGKSGKSDKSSREVVVVASPAYDSGSEPNDELCASIPGPFFLECDGKGGGGAPAGGEGYVHIHAGIHGIGDLNPSVRDWRNPVARITIRRVY